MRDALLDSDSSLLWVGDSKTNFEGSHDPVCKIHARSNVMSDFLGLATAKQTLGPSAPQSSCLQFEGEMSTRCQICRSADRWNGRFCLSLNSGRTAQYKHNAQSLRLFGLHGDVNDAHRAGANRLQNKQNKHFGDLGKAVRYLKKALHKKTLSRAKNWERCSRR